MELVALLIVSLISPTVLALLLGRQRHAEKIEDWARQDEVADRLLAANSVVGDKLDTIHTLVNSDMTLALEGQLAALKGQLAAILVLPEVSRDRVLISEIDAMIAMIAAKLTDRRRQATAAAEA